MIKDTLQIAQPDTDPFGLRGFDFSIRLSEKSELFTSTEARAYIDGCDYPESVDDLLLALEVQRLFSPDGRSMRILDAMCGPGRLGRELLNLGAQNVVFHDGDETMTTHARNQASTTAQPGQSMDVSTSPVDNIPLPDNMFDMVVCHNATHQLLSIERLHTVMKEFLRLTVPGGLIVIADYQRATTPDFLTALEERLQWTKPEIVPLLIPTFLAAFTKDEFRAILASIPGIERWSVTDAKAPVGLSQDMRERIEADPVKGHILDFSPISLRALIQKGKI